jgi:sRNA-binding protein
MSKSKRKKAIAREIHALIAELAQRFPQAFVANTWEPHRPLAIRVGNAILAECPDMPPKVLRLALGSYTKRLPYRQAVAAGGPRFNLAGEVEGEVALEHAEDARVRVEAMERKLEVRLANALAARKAENLKREAAKLAKREAAKQANAARQAPPPRLSIADLRAAAQARRATIEAA